MYYRDYKSDKDNINKGIYQSHFNFEAKNIQEAREEVEKIRDKRSEITEILSQNGWKKHNELKVGDIIATFNLEKNEIEYLSIKKLFARENEQIFVKRISYVRYIKERAMKQIFSQRLNFIPKREDFSYLCTREGYSIYYRADFLWGARVNTGKIANFNRDEAATRDIENFSTKGFSGRIVITQLKKNLANGADYPLELVEELNKTEVL